MIARDSDSEAKGCSNCTSYANNKLNIKSICKLQSKKIIKMAIEANTHWTKWNICWTYNYNLTTFKEQKKNNKCKKKLETSRQFLTTTIKLV